MEDSERRKRRHYAREIERREQERRGKERERRESQWLHMLTYFSFVYSLPPSWDYVIRSSMERNSRHYSH